MSGRPNASFAPPAGRRWARRIGWAVVVVGAAGYAGSGLYFVQPDERAVVRRFGRLTGAEKGPGLHYELPWPMGRVDRPKTTQVRRVVVGLSPEDKLLIQQGDVEAMMSSPQSDVLSGDINILKVTLIAQYRIGDPTRYVLRTVDPDGLVRQAVQATLIEALSRMPVDALLTTDRLAVRDAIESRSRRLLEQYETGVTLVSAAIQSIEPPRAVTDAFKAVTNEEYERSRKVHDAERDADRRIRDAQARAYERVQEASAYRSQRLARARGEADAFLKQHAEYVKAPGVTRARLFLAKMEELLPRVRMIVLDEQGGESPIELKLIEPRGGGGMR